MEKIIIKIIPHNKQRYETVGDYFIKNGELNICISDMGNFEFSMMVAIHELIEWCIVNQKGIKIEDIDKFDMNYEKERISGLHQKDEEPGNDPNAPYYKEHKFATRVEKALCRKLGIDWNLYDNTVNNLTQVKEEKKKDDGFDGGV